MYDVTCFLYFLHTITPLRSNIPCEDTLDIPMTLDATATTIPSPISSNIPEPRPGWLASEQSNAEHTQQANRAALLDGECLRATTKDVTKARGQRPQNRMQCAHSSHAAMMCLGAWSSGRIRASGARGRGFDSRSSPSHVAHVAARAAGQPRDARTPDAGQ